MLRRFFLGALLVACGSDAEPREDAHVTGEARTDAAAEDAQIDASPVRSEEDAKVPPLDAGAYDAWSPSAEAGSLTFVPPGFARDASSSGCAPLVSQTADGLCGPQLCQGSPLAADGWTGRFDGTHHTFLTNSLYDRLSLTLSAGFDGAPSARAYGAALEGVRGRAGISLAAVHDVGLSYRGSPSWVETLTEENGELHIAGWAVVDELFILQPTTHAPLRGGGVGCGAMRGEGVPLREPRQRGHRLGALRLPRHPRVITSSGAPRDSRPAA